MRARISHNLRNLGPAHKVVGTPGLKAVVLGDWWAGLEPEERGKLREEKSCRRWKTEQNQRDRKEIRDYTSWTWVGKNDVS